MGRRMDDEMEAVLRRFGDDDDSTLMDRFERMSFEVQLYQAILGRSLSEPPSARAQLQAPPLPPPLLHTQVRQGRRLRGSGFQKVFRKLMKLPMLGARMTKVGLSAGRKGNVAGAAKVGDDDDDVSRSWKAFSRSLRL